MSTILEKGKISVTSKDVLRYISDCDSLMREIGEVITRDIAIPSDKGYLLVFYPFGKDEYIFSIQYDRDLKFSFYTKRKFNIPRDMRYEILKI